VLSRNPSFFVSFLAIHAPCGARQQFSTVDLNLDVTFELPKGSSAVSHFFCVLYAFQKLKSVV